MIDFYDFSGRGGSIRSALRRRRAKDNWLRLVTTMRGVNIADCENLFIKDEYRHIVFTEEDMDAVLRGEYEVTTPTPDTDTRQDPSKRVRWRESLEEMFYEDPDPECVVVDLGQDKARPPPRRQIRRQFSEEEPGAGAGPVRGYCAPYNGAVCRNYIVGRGLVWFNIRSEETTKSLF